MQNQKKKNAGRTEGAFQLARLVSNQAAFAKELGVEQSTVSRWISGEKIPSVEYRAILSRELGIAERDWEEHSKKPTVSEVAPIPIVHRSKRRPIREIAADVEACAEALIRDMAKVDHLSTPAEKVKVLIGVSQALMYLGKISGETSQMTEAAILKTPQFRRAMGSIIDAITPWPDAMKAMVDRISEIEDGHADD